MSDLLDDAAISSRIILVRSTHKMSQDSFARSVGMNRSTLGNYETGYNRPRIDHAAAICKRYNLTLDWLYLGEEGGMRWNDLLFLGLR